MYAYDYKNNLLDITDKYGNHYCLQLRGNRTLIKGNSGTGKTFICDYVESVKRGIVQSKYDVGNIELISALNIEQLRQFKNKLIMIDRAEYVLSANDVLYINGDTFNRYLIFARVALGIDLSPNHQGDFVTKEGITQIEYRFSVKGWG